MTLEDKRAILAAIIHTPAGGTYRGSKVLSADRAKALKLTQDLARARGTINGKPGEAAQ